MIDFRQLVRGVALQALYEIDLSGHQPESVIRFYNDVDALQPDVRLLSYVAMRRRLQQENPPQDISYVELSLKKAMDERSVAEQVLIDQLSDGVSEAELEASQPALLARQLVALDVEEFDLAVESMNELLSDTYQQRARQIVLGVWGHQSWLDALIQRYAPDWPISQLAVVDRNILRLTLYEVLISRDMPMRVGINEAVELAKLFGADSSRGFINGVLGTISEHAAQILKEAPPTPNPQANTLEE